MPDMKRLDRVVASLVRRDQEMCDLEVSFREHEGQSYVSARLLGEFLEYKDTDNFMACVNRAQIIAAQTGRSVKVNFRAPELFDCTDGDDLWLTPWAAFASIIEADVRKPKVAAAKSYFASLAEHEIATDEARLKERQLFKSNHKDLHVSAQRVGIKGKEHALFDHSGYMGMYNKSIRDVERQKGVPKNKRLIDCAGATELAANNLRMAMTKDSLDNGEAKDKVDANRLHRMKGKIVRDAVHKGTGSYPENLPLEDKTIDQLSLKKAHEIDAQ